MDFFIVLFTDVSSTVAAPSISTTPSTSGGTSIFMRQEVKSDSPGTHAQKQWVLEAAQKTPEVKKAIAKPPKKRKGLYSLLNFNFV